jgi:hypothetical protein
VTLRSQPERDKPAWHRELQLETVVSELESVLAKNKLGMDSSYWQLSKFDLTVWMATETRIFEISIYNDRLLKRNKQWYDPYRHTVTRHAPFNAQPGVTLGELSACISSALHTLATVTRRELTTARRVAIDWPLIIRPGEPMRFGLPTANGKVALDRHRLKLYFDRLDPPKKPPRTARAQTESAARDSENAPPVPTD